jgi:hypothetical protein
MASRAGRRAPGLAARLRLGLLSRPCARKDANMEGFALAAIVLLCFTLVAAMVGFGPDVLEWIEDTHQN